MAIFNYLTSKGYDPKAVASDIARKIIEVYNKHNPYVDEHQVQIENNLTVEFARRNLANKDIFEALVKYFKMCIKSIPIELKSLLKRINIENERNPNDLYWRIAYSSNHNSAAACSQEEGIIYIYQYENNEIDFLNQNITSMYRTLTHELGHAYDYHYASEWGVETRTISSSQLWLDAMKKNRELNSWVSVSEYGANDPREDFAETIFYYLLGTDYLDKFLYRKKLLD